MVVHRLNINGDKEVEIIIMAQVCNEFVVVVIVACKKGQKYVTTMSCVGY